MRARLSVAGFRYRNVLTQHGGPIQAIETGKFPVRGRMMVQANAWLSFGLVRGRSFSGFYSTADGSGTDPVLSVARHKAVSEALERWAFHVVGHSDRASEFGFDIDPATNGMSAFPGLLRRQARRSAVLEAIERFSLIAWWDGCVAGEVLDTDWPGVSAVAINGPFGGVTVIVFARTEWGGYIYGHAAEESLGAACERAVVELARHEWIMRSAWLAAVAGERPKPKSIFEQRIVFFATEEGHEIFQSRVHAKSSGRPPRAEIICDAHIPGPWDDFATVWRFALRPPSDGYLRGGERYFFL